MIPIQGLGGISIWTLEGELITRWVGNEGPGKGLVKGGHDLCVDAEGSIYVCEVRGKQVSKFQRV